MKWKKLALVALPMLALALGVPGIALAGNLVMNGDFSSNGGNGQIGFNTSATGWYINPGASSSYTFLYGPASTTSGTTADNGGANGQYGNVSLWGPGNGAANGLTTSPAGGWILGQDSDFQQAAIQQTINGLTPGQSYTVGFWWAAAQQYGFSGATQSQWEVSLGSQTYSTAFADIASHGFSGWMYQTFNFTATDTSEVLSFFANGSPQVPPLALLDGVTLNANAVPEPASIVTFVAGMAGLVVVRLRQRARAAATA